MRIQCNIWHDSTKPRLNASSPLSAPQITGVVRQLVNHAPQLEELYIESRDESSEGIIRAFRNASETIYNS